MPENITEESVPDRWSAAANPGLWVDEADDPRQDGADFTDEKTTLVGYLHFYRSTMELKCAGLDPGQLATRSAPPSTMSLLGLIRHMADVERQWFRRVMAGQEAPPLYWSDDEDDRDWNGAVADPEVVARAWADWRDEVAFAERYVADADDLAVLGTTGDGETAQLRAILVHMIEEYARHCGHADLLRERIDGRVGV
jgi:uncharacterized damage-inducible protein DinB